MGATSLWLPSEYSGNVGVSDCDCMNGEIQFIDHVVLVDVSDRRFISSERNRWQVQYRREDERILNSMGQKFSPCRWAVHKRHDNISNDDVRLMHQWRPE